MVNCEDPASAFDHLEHVLYGTRHSTKPWTASSRGPGPPTGQCLDVVRGGTNCRSKEFKKGSDALRLLLSLGTHTVIDQGIHIGISNASEVHEIMIMGR